MRLTHISDNLQTKTCYSLQARLKKRRNRAFWGKPKTNFCLYSAETEKPIWPQQLMNIYFRAERACIIASIKLIDKHLFPFQALLRLRRLAKVINIRAGISEGCLHFHHPSGPILKRQTAHKLFRSHPEFSFAKSITSQLSGRQWNEDKRVSTGSANWVHCKRRWSSLYITCL